MKSLISRSLGLQQTHLEELGEEYLALEERLTKEDVQDLYNNTAFKLLVVNWLSMLRLAEINMETEIHKIILEFVQDIYALQEKTNDVAGSRVPGSSEA